MNRNFLRFLIFFDNISPDLFEFFGSIYCEENITLCKFNQFLEV